MDASSRIALVTGGSRGIGAAIARRCADAGAGVIVAARGIEACEAVARELRAQGARAWPLELDVAADAATFSEEMAELDALCEREGPVDWLVNNAGIANSAPLLPKAKDRNGASAGGAPEDPYHAHFAVNFHGPRRLVETLAPGMRTRGYGRVINVASSAALRGYAYVSAYCSSKFALLGFALAAAEELRGTGVGIHTVCPHYVDSPMLDASIQNLVDKTGMSADAARRFFVDQNPGKRLVAPSEVADAVLMLGYRDDTGAILELDGSDEPTLTHRS